MKNTILIVLLFFTILACTKEVIIDIAPQLRISVFDQENTKIASAKVNLYLTQEDWLTNVNIIKTLETDNNGEVFFENLQEEHYFFYIEKNNENNRYGIASIQEPLKINETANITVTLQPL
jgi:hypothetical protein